MSTPEVLVLGEALVDVVERNGTVAEHPGGSAANVALGLGRLGVPVELLTHIGSDPHGVLIREHLEASGVRVLEESLSAARTSTAVATIGPDGAAHYEFDVSWDVARPEPRRPLAPPVLHIGSFAAFLTPPELLLAFIRESGAREVSVDPNVRPALAGEHAEARRRFELVASACSIVKLSDEDAEWLYPGRAPEAVLDDLLLAGARLAVLTLGAEGLRLANPTARVSVPAHRVVAVDTIGAGDTVMASLLASLGVLGGRGMGGAGLGVAGLGGADLDEDALRRLGEDAARAAAVTVSRAGADLPWASELAGRPALR